MSIPGAGSPLFLSAAAAEAAAFQIDRSLRFNSGDSADLSKTFSSAGNRKTWTWSCWYKRSVLGTKNQRFFSCLTGSDDNTYLELRSFDNDTICLSGYATNFRVTDAEIRDPSAWYHLVVACDTTQGSNSDRIKLYINGVQQTFRTETTITQNADLGFNQAAAHKIGNAFDGYLAEIHFVDGSQLAASDFGEYDSDNNWNPKAYSGSYGTNGFHLDFSDNSSASALGTDAAGSNDWTVNNISVASGSGNDSLIDTPTNYTAASGNNGGNYATLNPLAKGTAHSLSNGNLDFSMPTSGGSTTTVATMGVSSGKWYWEMDVTSTTTYYPGIGIDSNPIPTGQSGSNSTGRMYLENGQKFNNATLTNYGAQYFAGDVIAAALDMDGGTITFYKNGVSQGQAFTGITGTQFPVLVGHNGAAGSYNFGQRPFAYTPPTGYVSLCTQNLPNPTIADGSTAMDVSTWTGTTANQSITGLNFSPDLVWIKARGPYALDHTLLDTVRGSTKSLASNTTAAESTVSYFNSFDSDGFTLNGGNQPVNGLNETHVGWTWDGGTSTVSNTDGSITSNVRANTSTGFSICTYTGSTGNQSFGHGLNDAPKFIAIKNRSNSANWFVMVDIGTTYYKYGHFNTTDAFADATAQPVSSTTVTLGNNNAWFGANGDNYVAYCWAPVAGYSAVTWYVGNASTDGPFVYTGFRPAFIMVKGSSGTGNWFMADTTRGTINVVDEVLRANLDNVELDSDYFDLLSNGFKVRNTVGGVNASGETFAVLAFAEHPFKTARAR